MPNTPSPDTDQAIPEGTLPATDLGMVRWQQHGIVASYNAIVTGLKMLDEAGDNAEDRKNALQYFAEIGLQMAQAADAVEVYLRHPEAVRIAAEYVEPPQAVEGVAPTGDAVMVVPNNGSVN